MSQGQGTGKLDRKSRIFFALFFLAILSSVAYTYYRIEVLHEFVAFTEEDEPEATDAYFAAYEWILSAIRELSAT